MGSAMEKRSSHIRASYELWVETALDAAGARAWWRRANVRILSASMRAVYQPDVLTQSTTRTDA